MVNLYLIVPGLGGIRGGAEASSIKLAEFLSNQNFNVIVVSDCSRGKLNYSLSPSITFYSLPFMFSLTNPYKLYANVCAFRDLLRGKARRYILCIGLPACIFYLMTKPLSHKDYIFIEHTVPRFYRYRPLLAFLLCICIFRCRTFCTVSSQARVSFKKTFGFDSFVLPNPLPSKPIFNVSTSNTAKSKTIVVSGRLVASKRPLEACKSFLESGLAHSGWKLYFAGDGPLYQCINKYIQSHSATGYVRLLGQLHSLDKLYTDAAFLLHCSVFESLGLSILESMSYCTVPILRDDLYSTRGFCTTQNSIFIDTSKESSIIASIRASLLFAAELYATPAYSLMSKAALSSYLSYSKAVDYESSWADFSAFLHG